MNESLTIHAYERARERSKAKGLRRTDERAVRAWEKGKKIQDYSSSKFQRYLFDVLDARGKEGKTLRVYGNEIYIFSTATRALITILTIPIKLQKCYGKGGNKNVRWVCEEEGAEI